MKSPLWVQGMHGLGDNIHQRAVLRQLMKSHSITLETSWPSVYHDLVQDGLRLVRRPVALRTQTKNAIREADRFMPINHPGNGQTMRIRYGGAEVRKSKSGTVLEAMCLSTGTSYADADYTLPVPEEWFQQLNATVPWKRAADKPVLVYRPLVARPEWMGSIRRNADPDSYAQLTEIIRDTFFVVSVADLEPNREWLIGPELRADVTLHKGELSFEAMASLFHAADMVFTSSGFAAILGPAVGTPTFSVVGGYESIGCHDSGARFAPYLAVGPAVECGCWTSQCHAVCDKRVAIPRAVDRLHAFMAEIGLTVRPQTTPREQMFTTPTVQPPAPTPGRAFVAQRQQLHLMMQRQGLKA